MRGQEVGDEVSVDVPPEEAYGERDPERMMEIPRDRLEGVEPEVGQVLGLQDQQGQAHQATVAKVSDETVTLDFNHMLAGKTLTFKIQIVAVE